MKSAIYDFLRNTKNFQTLKEMLFKNYAVKRNCGNLELHLILKMKICSTQSKIMISPD